MSNHRTALLRSKLPLGGRGLEIGPSYNPLVAKSDGFDVETADYTDAEGLRQKYAGNPHVDVARIEAVDHVLDGSKSLSNGVNQPGAFDYIVASHVIEHTPDMLGFLLSCQTLLKPDGILLLAVPDKRHCFDVLQPLTSTGMILQAHLDNRCRPSPGTIFDDVAYNAVRDDAIGWGPDDTRKLRFFATIEVASYAYSQAVTTETYRDVHVWRFVPSSFRLILSDLHEIGALKLREAWFHESVGNEFYTTLSPNGIGCGQDRMALATAALTEHAKILL